ncbi:MAG: protein kinase [bacterium]|nr:protein kinase [bacterium]
MKPHERDPKDTVSEDMQTEYSPPPTGMASGERTKTETAEETREREVPPELDYLILGKYRLVKMLGKGGMGEIYLAEHTELRKLVAIKIISEQLMHSPQFTSLFKREARSAARLQHPYIARVFDYGEEKGKCFYVMDYIQGQSLADIIDTSGRFPLKKALEIFRQMLEALDHAHQAGIIHRDIKPSNILIDESGAVKLLDFGLARSVYAEDSLTAVGQSPGGTPSYTSPEQRRGDPTDARTDIYSAGVTMFEMLTGALPRDVASPRERLSSALNKTINPLQKVRASQAINVVMKCLAEPGERYKTAQEVLADVRRIERGMQQQRWVIRSAAGAVAAAAAAVIVVLALTPPKLQATDAVKYLEEDKFSRAAKLFAEMTRKNPSDVKSRYGLGLSYVGLGELERAKVEFEKIATSAGQDTTADEEGLARVAYASSDEDEALRICQEAIDTGKEHTLVHVTLGDIHRLRNQLDQAVEEYQKALARKPMFSYQLAEAYAGLGYVLMKKGDYDKAMEAVKNAEEKKSGDDVSAFLREEIARKTDAARQERIGDLVDELIKQAERTQQTPPADTYESRPVAVAILDLKRTGLALDRAGEYEMLMFHLSRALQEGRRVTVVEREVLEALLTELRLGTTDLADPSAALRLGKFLPAGLIVAGTLRGEKGRFGVDLRLVETETSGLKKMLSQERQGDETTVEFAERLAKRLTNEVRQLYPLKARILKVDAKEATLNIGSKHGLATRTEMNIVELPEKKEIGKLIVRQVKEESALADIVEVTGQVLPEMGAEETVGKSKQ